MDTQSLLINPVIYGAATLIALLVSMYTTPLFRQAAQRCGVVDKPDGRLKNQCEPVPYFGGLAVYAAFLTAVAVAHDLDQQVLGLLLSGTMIAMLGLVDDFGVLTPRVKLFFQCVAAAVLIRSGIYVKLSFLPLWLDMLLTFIWLVGLANAFNIIDIMDGLASTVAAVSSFALAGFAIWSGRQLVAVLAFALGGACLGFLRYNRQPAKIYLGDTGSMFIGFMLGALSFNNYYTRSNELAGLAPFLLLGVPVFDTFFVMVMRTLAHRPIMHGSPDHFALRLRRAGLTVRQVVGLAGVAQAVLCGIAVLLVLANQTWAAALIALTVLAGLVAGVLLGRIRVDYPQPGPAAPPAATPQQPVAPG